MILTRNIRNYLLLNIGIAGLTAIMWIIESVYFQSLNHIHGKKGHLEFGLGEMLLLSFRHGNFDHYFSNIVAFSIFTLALPKTVTCAQVTVFAWVLGMLIPQLWRYHLHEVAVLDIITIGPKTSFGWLLPGLYYDWYMPAFIASIGISGGVSAVQGVATVASCYKIWKAMHKISKKANTGLMEVFTELASECLYLYMLFLTFLTLYLDIKGYRYPTTNIDHRAHLIGLAIGHAI